MTTAKNAAGMHPANPVAGDRLHCANNVADDEGRGILPAVGSRVSVHLFISTATPVIRRQFLAVEEGRPAPGPWNNITRIEVGDGIVVAVRGDDVIVDMV